MVRGGLGGEEVVVMRFQFGSWVYVYDAVDWAIFLAIVLLCVVVLWRSNRQRG